jgi:hypothetical protein
VHNVHGTLEVDADGIYETQDLVIATHAMPLADWRRTRTFCWMSALLHFDKLLQIPLIVAHEISGISYRQMIEAFVNDAVDGYPLLREIRDLLLEAAAAIQAGGPEYLYSEEWLGMFWPADEYMFIKLVAENRLDQFYREASALLRQLLAEHTPGVPLDLIDQAILLNRSLIKQPFCHEDTTVELGYDIWKFYRERLTGQDVSVERQRVAYRIDRTSERWTDLGTWCRDVVWYGSRKGAYLYGNRAMQNEIAGHH